MLKGIVQPLDDGSGHRNLQWRSIAENLPGRSGKQCRERWCYHLRPNIKKGGWTEAEDSLIDRLQKKIGNKWTTIAESLPGRTDNDVKNRWHTCKKKKANKKGGTAKVSKPKRASEKKSRQAPAIDHKKTPMRSVSATPNTGHGFTMSIDKFDLSSAASSTFTTTKHVRFTPFDNRSRESFMLQSWTEKYLSMQLPSLPSSTDGVHADDIFSPSFFPRLMTAPASAATPYTPGMPLSVVSSCYSGPFITSTPSSNDWARRCMNVGNNMPIMGVSSTGVTQHSMSMSSISMTPLPYKKIDTNHKSIESITEAASCPNAHAV